MEKYRKSSKMRWCVAFFVSASVFGITSCGGSLATTDTAVSKDIPDVVFTGFERQEVEKGVVVFTAKADKAEYYASESRLVLYGLSFEQKSSDGLAVESTGEAGMVVYHEDTGNAEFSGNVKLYSKSGNASFQTSSLRYLGASQTLEGGPSDMVVVQVGEKLFLSGKGFIADVRAKTFGFSDGLQGTIWAKNAGGPK
jgi:LPS export ABC transporter protein LptC